MMQQKILLNLRPEGLQFLHIFNNAGIMGETNIFPEYRKAFYEVVCA